MRASGTRPCWRSSITTCSAPSGGGPTSCSSGLDGPPGGGVTLPAGGRLHTPDRRLPGCLHALTRVGCMNLANIPLAAKVYFGAIGGLALLGGGVAIGAHVGGGAQPASSTAIVASPSPSASASPSARNTAAQAVRRAALSAEAQVLGVSPKQLDADFKAGTTVQQLATAKGLSQSEFQAQFQTALKDQLDQEVRAG